MPVTDNQLVEAGTALVRLDDRDFRAQADQATAQVDQAKANMASIDAQVAAQQARIDQADKQTAQSQAALTFAQQQEKRYTALVKTGAGSVEQAQQYASNLLQAQANYAAAQANAVATEAQLPGRRNFGARSQKIVASRLCDLGASASAVRQADSLRGAAHPVINIRTSEHHVFSRPLLSVRMFGSWGKKRANASSNCAAL